MMLLFILVKVRSACQVAIVSLCCGWLTTTHKHYALVRLHHHYHGILFDSNKSLCAGLMLLLLHTIVMMLALSIL